MKKDLKNLELLNKLKDIKNWNYDQKAVLLTIIILIIYISTMSISLDEEDSVHFALALNDFNVTKFQPHPPGFTVYVGIGNVFNAILMNETLSLTLMSAILGALAVFLLYKIASEMCSKEVAFMAAAIMSLTPLFWINSLKAMTDIPGLFFVLFSLLFIYKYIKYGKTKYFFIATIIAGIAGGVRIHALIMLIPVLAFGALYHRKKIVPNFIAGVIFLIVLSAWFVPTLLLNGVTEYLTISQMQLDYRVGKPHISILGSELSMGYLGERIYNFGGYFSNIGYGIGAPELGAFSFIILLLMGGLALLFIKKTDLKDMIKDKRTIFFLMVILFYLPSIFITVPPTNPRYLLVLVPVLSLFFAWSLTKITKPQQRYALFLLLLLLLTIHSISPVIEIRTTPSAPLQLVEFIGGNGKQSDYVPEDYIVLGGYMDKYFDYYDVKLQRLHANDLKCGTIRTNLIENKKVLSSLRGCLNHEGLKLTEIKTFERSQRVHVKRYKATLYEFTLA